MPATESIPGRIAHIGMPFALSDSAINHVIRELVAEHARAGGESTVVLSHNRDTTIDGRSELYVDHTIVCPREYFTAHELRRDHVAGLVGRVRPFTAPMAIPAIEALRGDPPPTIIVHEGHYATGTLPLWRRAFSDVKLVLYVHTPISRAYRSHELGRLLASCDDVVFVSDALRRQTLSRAHTRTRTHAILNGTRPAKLAAGRDIPRTLLFVGQLVPWKGAHLVIDAVAHLRDQGMTIPTTIIGAKVHGSTSSLSPYESDLRKAAADLDGLVSFRGYVPRNELDAEYRSAGLVCFPSTWEEPCGLVLLEAIGNGAAVIASRRGGIPEVGKDAVAYFDVREPGALAAAIRSLFESPESLRELRTLAHQRAAEITWSHQYAELIRALS